MKFNQDLCLNLQYDFRKMNSTLGSVVPLAMFSLIGGIFVLRSCLRFLFRASGVPEPRERKRLLVSESGLFLPLGSKIKDHFSIYHISNISIENNEEEDCEVGEVSKPTACVATIALAFWTPSSTVFSAFPVTAVITFSTAVANLETFWTI